MYGSGIQIYKSSTHYFQYDDPLLHYCNSTKCVKFEFIQQAELRYFFRIQTEALLD